MDGGVSTLETLKNIRRQANGKIFKGDSKMTDNPRPFVEVAARIRAAIENGSGVHLDPLHVEALVAKGLLEWLAAFERAELLKRLPPILFDQTKQCGHSRRKHLLIDGIALRKRSGSW